MKKSVLIAIVVVIVVAVAAAVGAYLVLTPKPTLPTKPVHLKFVTNVKGTGWYVMGAAMATVIEKELPEGSTVEVLPEPAIPTPVRLHKGEVQLGLTFPTIAKWAIEGVHPYEGKASPKLRAVVANLDRYWVAFAVTKDSGITSFDQIKEERIPVRLVLFTKGTQIEIIVKALLEEYGITYEDIEKWGGSVEHVTSLSTMSAMIKDGRANAIAHVATPGHPTWTELCLTKDMVFLPVKDEVANRLVERFGIRKDVIPADTFKGVDEDVPTVGWSTLLVTSSDVPEEVIYAVTKAIIEHKDELVAAYPALKYLKPENAWKTIIPLHPGAEKYYKEMGYMK